MNDAQIKHMVDRFLTWKLPENFTPDAGISFEPLYNNGTARHEPTGTNLFDAQQAEMMILYITAGLEDDSLRVAAQAVRKFAPDLADELVRRHRDATNAIEDFLAFMRNVS